MGCVESTGNGTGALSSGEHVISEPRKVKSSLQGHAGGRRLEASKQTLFKEFTLDALRTATNGFSAGNLLSEHGEVNWNFVYKGWLVEDGRWVAVKRFRTGAWPDAKAFTEEAVKVGSLRHDRLVKLIGCCSEKDERILVAEYMPNDTLVQHLFQWEDYPMNWDTRLTVALSVIQALNYCSEHGFAIYHDLSTCRVLFDHDRHPRLSCFGLMKNNKGGVGYSSNLAYLPPESISTGLIQPGGVIFSFGTLLIDLLSGKRIPPLHALEIIRAKNLTLLMDSCLEIHFWDKDGAELVRLAAMCLHQNPGERPSGKMLASSLTSLQRRLSVEKLHIDVKSPEMILSPLRLTATGEICSRMDLTGIHEVLMKLGYKDDDTQDHELSFQVWIKMQEMLNSRSKGDAAFSDKDFSASAGHYTEFINTETVASPTVHVRRALSYLLLDQPHAALADAMQAEILLPKWPIAFYTQSVALTKMGMVADAKDMLKEATLLEMKQRRKHVSLNYP